MDSTSDHLLSEDQGDMTPELSAPSEVTAFQSPCMDAPPSISETYIVNHVDETQSLTYTDVKSDPILLSLAKKQQSRPRTSDLPKSASTSFKARPAPRVVDGAGPRMTKAAALRQGLKWETMGAEKKEEVVFHSTPGHKREGLNIVSRG